MTKYISIKLTPYTFYKLEFSGPNTFKHLLKIMWITYLDGYQIPDRQHWLKNENKLLAELLALQQLHFDIVDKRFEVVVENL